MGEKLMTDYRSGKNYRRGFLICVCIVLLVGVICLITGIALLARGSKSCRTVDQRKTTACDYSTEARDSGLDKFFHKVQDAYYKLHPFNLYKKTGVSSKEVRQKFKPYDPSPRNLKKTTDAAFELLDELNSMDINLNRLKPREWKAVAQLKHYLQHVFGTAFDGNYYAGDYLLGPNLWCWQQFCYMGYHIYNNFRHFKPSTSNDLEPIRKKLEEFKTAIEQYVENMRSGVKVGMVRSVEQCKAAVNGFASSFKNVSINGEKGIFGEWYTRRLLNPTFLSNLKPQDMKDWKAAHGGQTVNDSLKSYVLDNLGKPLDSVFRYLRTEYLEHCVPNNVSSGLAGLPVDYVYTNLTADPKRLTTKKLPTGEPLDGRESYRKIVSYFTTTNITPEEIQKLGNDMLHKLYPEVLEIARLVTNQSDNDTARELFVKRLNESDMYFNTEDIPSNESNKNAHKLCSDIEGAKKHCPVRWRTIQNWFNWINRQLSILDPKTTKMFYFTGTKHTTPNCPISLKPDFNPSGGASYGEGSKSCNTPATYYVPFFEERPGTRYEETSTVAHEGRPGHHTQGQGNLEHFVDRCGGIIQWLDSSSYYTAFTEGWGLYAENPLIGRDTDTYEGKPLEKYGMLKWQVWRALRLIVDSGLHYEGFSRNKALKYFADFAWDTGDVARKEVTRYQSAPGQATAYMIGQLHIMKLREYAKKELGKKFSLKDFHYHILSQGSAPLGHLEDSIKRYVSCAKSPDEEWCDVVLNPKAKDTDSGSDEIVSGDKNDADHDIARPRVHYF